MDDYSLNTRDNGSGLALSRSDMNKDSFIFSVHVEENEILALYMNPCTPEEISLALERSGMGESYISLEISKGIMTSKRIVKADLREFCHPLELVHDNREETPRLALPVIADPDTALHPDSGRRYALSLSEDGHAIVYSRENALIQAILESRLRDYASARLDDSIGSLPVEMMRVLAEPIADEQWREAHLIQRSGRNVFQFQTFETTDHSTKSTIHQIGYIVRK